MWVFRAVWQVLRSLEIIAVNLGPARASRVYLRWRLKGNVPPYKQSTMLSTLAEAERKLGDLKASEAAAREALRIAPDYWDAYAELALTLEAAGRPREARDALQMMLAMPGFDRRYQRYVQREIQRLASSRAPSS